MSKLLPVLAEHEHFLSFLKPFNMKLEQVKITPSKAKEWLEMNFEHNRKLRSGQVQKYASDMQQKRWHETGDPIKFNTMGQLVDGQHRLHAIVMANISVKMWVAYDVPVEAIKVIDTGASRSTGDVLAINGQTGNTKHLATLIRRIISWERNDSQILGRGFKSRRDITNQDILDYAEKHADTIRHIHFAMRLYASSITPGMLSMGDWAILHYIFSQMDPTAAEDFLTRLATLDGLTIGHPIRVLFDKMNGKISLTPKMKLQFTLRAWNAWRNGDQTVVLKVRDLEENPIPELV